MGKSHSPEPFLAFAAEVLNDRLTTLTSALALVRKEGDVDAVHDARVASRRLRSGLALLEEAYGRKKFRRWRSQLRGITRTLGELRDTDVQLVLVNHRLQPESGASGQAGLACLHQRLERQRKQQHRKVRKAVGKLRRKETLETMAVAWQQWHGTGGDASALDPTVRDQARPLVLAHLEETDRLTAPLPLADQAEELHDLRLALKQLRYTLEFVAPAFAGQLDSYVSALKELQALLGDLHDADVWITRLPKFTTKQAKRLRRKEAPIEEQTQLTTDLNALLEDRRQHRASLYEQLRQQWQEQQHRGTWARLRQLMEPETVEQKPTVSVPPTAEPPASEEEIKTTPEVTCPDHTRTDAMN